MVFTIKKSKRANWGYEITSKGFHNITPSVDAAIVYLKDRYGPYVKYRVKGGEDDGQNANADAS